MAILVRGRGPHYNEGGAVSGGQWGLVYGENEEQVQVHLNEKHASISQE